MCFLSLEDAEACAEHHMSICQRRRQVQQKRQRKTTRKQDDKNCQVDGQEESVYCICRRGEDQGFMIQCSNCNKWFHGECVASELLSRMLIRLRTTSVYSPVYRQGFSLDVLFSPLQGKLPLRPFRKKKH